MECICSGELMKVRLGCSCSSNLPLCWQYPKKVCYLRKKTNGSRLDTRCSFSAVSMQKDVLLNPESVLKTFAQPCFSNSLIHMSNGPCPDGLNAAVASTFEQKLFVNLVCLETSDVICDVVISETERNQSEYSIFPKTEEVPLFILRLNQKWCLVSENVQ